MNKIPSNFVDLILTSPPYDNARDYEGFRFDFSATAEEMFRILKDGGVLVWIVGDTTKNFCESLTSFRQALHFVDNVGFSLLDTMIYKKNSGPPTYPNIMRYTPSFEYMFVLVKGKKPKTFNPIKDKERKYKDTKLTGTARQKDGSKREVKEKIVSSSFSMRDNVWCYNTGFMISTKDKIAFEHPAIFPEALAFDHIVTWSKEGDLVYDPFMGSGTTLKMAKKLKRKYIGSEISTSYCDIAKQRLLLEEISE